MREVRLSGPLTNYGSAAQGFILTLDNALAVAVVAATRESIDRLHALLLRAADGEAFTRLVGNTFNLDGYARNNEPAYIQSLLLIPLSLSYDLLQQTHGQDDPGLTRIRQWGDRLFHSASHAGDRLQNGYDRWAGKAAGFAMWGAVSSNHDALSLAWKLFRTGQSVVDRSGRHFYGRGKPNEILKYSNMAIGMQVLAAEALTIAGVADAYDYRKNDRKGSLHDAVRWLVEYSDAQPNSFLTNPHHDSLKGLAWVEFYLARFAGTPAGARVAQLLKRPLYNGIFTAFFGGWTTCLVSPLD